MDTLLLKKLKRSKSASDLTDIEKLLLPVTVSSAGDRYARRMVYVAIRKYLDLSLPNTTGSLDVMVSKYYSLPKVKDFCDLIRKEIYKDEDISKEALSKDSILNGFREQLERAENSGDEKLAADIRMKMSTIQGFTRAQKDNDTQKFIYVPLSCHDCPMYIQKKKEIEE